MYPITRESVMAVISSSVAENAVCWCDGRKKRNRRIVCRLTHLAVGGGVIAGAESGMAIGFACEPLCSLGLTLLDLYHRGHRGTQGEPKSLRGFDTVSFRPA